MAAHAGLLVDGPSVREVSDGQALDRLVIGIPELLPELLLQRRPALVALYGRFGLLFGQACNEEEEERDHGALYPDGRTGPPSSGLRG